MKSDAGASLVGTAMTVGVISALVLASSELLVATQKSQVRAREAAQVDRVYQQISDYMNDLSACRETFKDLRADTNPVIQALKTGSGGTAFEVGQSFGPPFIKMKTLQLTSYAADDVLADPYLGTAALKIQFERQLSANETQTIDKEIRLRMALHSSGSNQFEVENCRTLGMADSIWSQKLDGTVYYQDGMVAIGHKNPDAYFDILDERTQNGVSSLTAKGRGKDFRLYSYSDQSKSDFDHIRYRGDSTNKQSVQEDDVLGSYAFWGYDGSQFQKGTEIASVVDDNVRTGNINVPSRLEFRTREANGGGAMTAKMVIKGNGNVGIGTDDPDEMLEVKGDAMRDNLSTWGHFSDARLKTKTGDYEKGLDEIRQIDTVRYHYIAKPSVEVQGVIAQEIRKVFPEAVEKGIDGFLRLSIDPIVWAIPKALRELQEKFKSALNQEPVRLEAEVEKRRQKLEELRSRMKELRGVVGQLQGCEGGQGE